MVTVPFTPIYREGDRLDYIFGFCPRQKADPEPLSRGVVSDPAKVTPPSGGSLKIEVRNWIDHQDDKFLVSIEAVMTQ